MSKKKARLILSVCSAVFLLCAAVLILVIRDRLTHEDAFEMQPIIEEKIEEEHLPDVPAIEVPVDFDAWQSRNSDIYAWLEIPGTVVNYPVVQRAEDDSFYLRRDVDGAASIAGSIFTESTYTSTDFNDPVTVIYGHNMANGTMFGSLRPWICESGWLETTHYFTIYQPGRILTYRIVGGVPYNDSHLLYWNDFSDAGTFYSFFDGLYDQHGFYTNLLPDAMPHSGDRVVILSTCMGSNQRYLVIGVLTEDTAS